MLRFLPFFLLLASPVLAQDWAPFPLDQKGLFIRDNFPVNLTAVDIRVLDSVETLPGESILRFDRNLDLTPAETCTETLYDEYELFLSSHLDSLIQRNDTLFSYSDDASQPFYFVPHAAVGDSWVIASDYVDNDYDSVTISCISITLDTFLGLVDSVKTFTLTSNDTTGSTYQFSDYELRLSKHYGLLEYLPFQLFLVHPSWEPFQSVRLIGLESGGQSYGYRQPELADYFPYAAGDILLWDLDVNPFDPNDPDRWFWKRDSITQVSITADTLSYTYDRTEMDENSQFTVKTNQKQAFPVSNYDALFGGKPAWVGAINESNNDPNSPYRAIWNLGPLLIKPDPNNPTDTVSSIRFENNGFYLDTSDCTNGQIVDGGEDEWFDTRLGLTQFCYYSWGYRCHYLRGSRLSGVVNGDIDLPVGINEPAQLGILTIFPNPAQNEVNLQTPGGERITSFRIVSVSGQIIRQETSAPGQRIDITNLAPGMYWVEAESQSGRFRGKLVKQ